MTCIQTRIHHPNNHFHPNTLDNSLVLVLRGVVLLMNEETIAYAVVGVVAGAGAGDVAVALQNVVCQQIQKSDALPRDS
jgi:hypothetical protein